jgi:hypothetical protein
MAERHQLIVGTDRELRAAVTQAGAGSDTEVIKASRREPDQFTEIFDRYYEEIHRYVDRRLGADADAVDLAAETFLIAFRQRAEFDAHVSDRVRIATYRILAGLNGVRIVTATDAGGRTGQAVTMREATSQYGSIDWQLFIDPSTGQLTASQGIVVQPGTDNVGLPPGTRQFSEVVNKAEWTNTPADRLRPEWVRMIDRRVPPG